MNCVCYNLFWLVLLGVSIVSCSSEQPSKSAADLNEWRYEASLFPEYLKSEAETQFSKKALELVEKNKLKICYGIESASYFLVHLLPLAHALPGPFCGVAGERWTQNSISILKGRGYKDEGIFPMKYDDLKIFAEEGGVILTLHSLSGHGIKTFVLPHGIDEDIIYMSKDGTFEFSKESEYNTETFVFSRFNRINNGFQPGVEARQLDEQRKTVVYVGTIGNWEFLDEKSPVAQKTLEQLMNLKKRYNVILRLHPQLDPQMTKKLKDHFTDIDFSLSPSLLPLYDLADIVIGAPGGAITSATFKAEIPLVLLRPTQWWPALKPTFTMDEVAEKNKGFVLGPETAIHQNEHTLDLEKAVEEALNDPNHVSKIEKRKEYFKNWFGCIDGYEEYRVAIKIFEHKNIDISSLKQLYNLFERYENRPICKYEGV